jgi:hypothetical protein
MLLRSPCKNLKPYDKHFCDFSNGDKNKNLAKLDYGLDESPTVMVGFKKRQNSVKIRAY